MSARPQADCVCDVAGEELQLQPHSLAQTCPPQSHRVRLILKSSREFPLSHVFPPDFMGEEWAERGHLIRNRNPPHLTGPYMTWGPISAPRRAWVSHPSKQGERCPPPPDVSQMRERSEAPCGKAPRLAALGWRRVLLPPTLAAGSWGGPQCPSCTAWAGVTGR